MTGPLAPSYAEARRWFLEAATAAGASVTTSLHPDRLGPGGVELAVDVADLGPPDSRSALWVVSGTHGVEGYAGSAIQTHWLTQLADGSVPAGVRLVLVHGLNPYGFAWTRRTNEDNVDLNRNFIDWSEPPPTNPAYDRLAELLVPEVWDDETRDATTASLWEEADRIGMAAMDQAISGGQYRHPRGLFYGGGGRVWSNRWLSDHARRLAGKASRVGIIDLHTGLGQWGHGELIVSAGRADAGYLRAGRWWGDVKSMTDGESTSSRLSGDWLGHIESLLPGVEVTAAALEFGTVDAIQVLQALRGEAWLHDQSPSVVEGPVGDAIRAAVRAAFADDGPGWLPALQSRFEEVAAASIVQLAG